MTANNLLERYQSAYKSHHSTETALILVQNDILGALDRRYGVILVLLDMSAAFDTVTRIVVHCHRCEHITPVLMKLHWLPVKQRVQYSILLLVFRAQHRLAPPYITDLLEQRATRVLRSTTNNDFYVPPSRSRYGDRMCSVAGPRLWNSLPAEMKKTCCLVTFKRLENPLIPGCV